MIEVTGLRTGRQYERIVRDPPAIAQDDLTRGDIEVRHIPQNDLGVALMSEDVTNGRSDFTGRKSSGSNLIEQRLKEMVIVAVDHSDFDGRILQGLGRVQAGETAADDYHLMHIYSD